MAAAEIGVEIVIEASWKRLRRRDVKKFKQYNIFDVERQHYFLPKKEKWSFTNEDVS